MNPLKIDLEPRSIASCPHPDIPEYLLRAFPYGMLQHQVELYQASEDNDIVLDLSATGTGKTSAGLAVIDHNRDRNAIYIAPTNALIEQQTEAARKFVQDADLPHIVKAASARHIKQWSDDKVGHRSGEKLYNVLREPATLFPECAGRPILLVTNPDIFYYSTFFAYNRLDKSNIASVFYNSFATVIFDEFHLYDAKQLVSLLFYLALSKVFGYFQHNRKVVLLTATPEPACAVALGKLAKVGTNVCEVRGDTATSQMLPSQTTVSLELRPHLDKKALLDVIEQEVLQRVSQNPDEHGAVILDSLDQLNRLNDRLCDAGVEHFRGRITGPEQSRQKRHEAAQRLVILATSTVDVGFNFDRDDPPDRQNLDWLIFSSRDRFSFWQRIGRVGRVLGKKQTDIPSEAIAYLPEKAWEEGIEKLDCSGGREALRKTLEQLDCLKRPFLEVYWKSEAFLEVARPLLELESSLHNLEQEYLVQDLYKTLQSLLGGSRSWQYYKHRMMQIITAETLAKAPIKPKKPRQWSFTKTLFKQSQYGRREFIKLFLKINYPEQLEGLNRKEFPIDEIENEFKEYEDLAIELRNFSILWRTIWSPLFQFRNSLFNSLKISDPHCLLLDAAGETNLDPIHLLRFYEFETDGDRIEVLKRAEEPYSLSFSLTVEDLDEFNNVYLSKLYAFENCHITRMYGDMIRPTPKIVEKNLIPGVVVSESTSNRWTIIKLRRQGLVCYPIKVSDAFSDKSYLFFPSLSGILAIASAGVALKCPDDEEFFIA